LTKILINWSENLTEQRSLLIVPFEEKKLTVPMQAIPWPDSARRRISINSFGVGGSNFHVRVKKRLCLRRKFHKDVLISDLLQDHFRLSGIFWTGARWLESYTGHT
jgi:hypothetical protein